LREICANKAIGLFTEIDLILVEKRFVQIDLIEPVSIEDALLANLIERVLHFRNGGGNIIAGGERSVEILERANGATAAILKKLIAGNIAGNGISARELHVGGAGISVVGDRVCGGVQGKGLRAYLRAGKDKGALIAGIAKTYGLVEETLDFSGDGLAVGTADRAGGALGAKAKSTRQDGDDITQRGIGHLKATLQSAEIGKELSVSAGLVVILHDRSRGGGIVGKLIDAQAAAELLRGGVLVLLALFNGVQKVRQEIWIQSNRHNQVTRLMVVCKSVFTTFATCAEA